MKDTSGNILIAGVGGQGSLLASRILGRVALDAGRDVKVSEVHGMSQRGGSVVTYVRYGDRVYSPIIGRGGADVIVAFELLEAARAIEYLAPGGAVVVNTERINPMSVASGERTYPEGLEDAMRSRGARVYAVDCLSLAKKAGAVKAVNVVLLGRLSVLLDADRDEWMRAIERCVPPKLLDINKKAFDLGRAAD